MLHETPASTAALLFASDRWIVMKGSLEGSLIEHRRSNHRDGVLPRKPQVVSPNPECADQTCRFFELGPKRGFLSPGNSCLRIPFLATDMNVHPTYDRSATALTTQTVSVVSIFIVRSGLCIESVVCKAC